MISTFGSVLERFAGGSPQVLGPSAAAASAADARTGSEDAAAALPLLISAFGMRLAAGTAALS